MSHHVSFRPISKILSNGLKVIVLHTPTDPVSAAHLFIPAGAAGENPSDAGVTALGCALLSKGTVRKSARAFAEEVESVGGSVSAGVTHDYIEISCHAIADYFPKTLSLMAEGMLSPAFAETEAEKERGALLATIRSKRESIFTVANEELNRRIYGKHPYSRPSTGTEKSAGSLTSSDLRKWHGRVVAPTGAVLSIACSRPAEQLFREAEELFGARAWPRRRPSALPIPVTPQTARKAHVTKTEPFEQAYLLVGYPAPAVSSPWYFSLKVLNAVLGGGMSARLFQRLREQKGLAYDVGAFYPSKGKGSAFVAYMGLQEDKIEEAKKGMLDAFEELRDGEMPKAELDQVKNYLKGTYVLDHQTNSQRSHYVGWWEILGLGMDFDRKYIPGLDAVGVKEILGAAKHVFRQPPTIIEVRPKKGKKGK